MRRATLVWSLNWRFAVLYSHTTLIVMIQIAVTDVSRANFCRLVSNWSGSWRRLPELLAQDGLNCPSRAGRPVATHWHTVGVFEIVDFVTDICR